MTLTISNAQRISWEIAEEKGFNAIEQTVGDRIALMHSELSEALEEYRNGHAPDEVYYPTAGSPLDKPEGVGVELADCVIRIMHFCEDEGIHLDDLIMQKLAYNRTRPHLHGGKIL